MPFAKRSKNFRFGKTNPTLLGGEPNVIMQRMAPDLTFSRQRENPHSSDARSSSSPTLWGSTHPGSFGGVLISIALFALATNFLYFAHFSNFYSADSSTYITPASNLLGGHGFTDSDDRPEANRTPGYPLLITPFVWAGIDLRYLVMFQHLMLALLAVATAAAAFQVSRSRRQALLAGILLSIDLPMLEAANTILTETMFTVTFAAALWLLWTGSRQPEQPWMGRLLVSGLLAGASVLIRPIGVFFFLPAALYLLLAGKRFRLRAALVFTVAFACFPLMWATRNYHKAGYFQVSSISGFQLLGWRAAGVVALNDPGDFNSNVAKRRAQLEDQACRELKVLYGKSCSELSFAQKSEYQMRLSRKILAQHPIGYLKLALRGAAVMLLDGGPTSLEGMTGINPHRGIRLLLIYTVPAFCFAVVGLLRLWNTNRRLFYLSFLTISYFVTVSSGAESYSRYRVPIVPVYVILIAAGVDTALKLRTPRRL